MKTTINDTVVHIEMGGFDKHLHSEYLKYPENYNPDFHKKPAKPFRVAYITLKTINDEWGEVVPEHANEMFNAKLIPEHGGPDKIWQTAGDTFLAFVDVEMIDNISPRLRFSIVNREIDWEGQFANHSEDYAHSVLDELSDAIRYHEI